MEEVKERLVHVAALSRVLERENLAQEPFREPDGREDEQQDQNRAQQHLHGQV